MHPQGGVGMVAADRPSGVHERTDLLGECDPLRQLGELLGLIVVRSSSMPKCPNSAVPAAKARVWVRCVGMRVRRADVRAEQLRRNEEARPPLDLLSLQRVVAVTGPDPVGPIEDLQIDPPAPPAQLSISTPGCRRRISSSSAYRASVWRWTAACHLFLRRRRRRG